MTRHARFGTSTRGTGTRLLTWIVPLVGITGLGLLLAACGGDPETPSLEEKTKIQGDWQIPALRFVGADGVYALRRIAAEAGLLLVLDEVRTPGGIGEDLAWEYIDIDLPAGPLGPALEAMREAAPGFDYRVANGLMFVRTTRALAMSKTEFDFPVLPATRIEADLVGFTRWLMQNRPLTFLRAAKTRGEPVFKRADLQIPEGTSVMDAILMFSLEVNRGLRLRRGGYEVQDGVEGMPDGGKAVVSSTIGMWEPLDDPRPVPKERTANAIVEGVAALEDRFGVPITVVDRTVLGDLRGSLCYGFAAHTDHVDDLDAALDLLRTRYDGPDHFEWKRRDGMVEVTTRTFTYYMTGHDLFEAELEPGLVKGSFYDLVRHLNERRKQPNRRRIWAGEVVDDAPPVEIDITDGMRVRDALHAYAKQTGEGWYYVTTSGETPAEDSDETWHGARLTRLLEWGPKARTPAW